MGIPGGDPKEYDYRKLPRKRDGERRTAKLEIAVTPSELDAVRDRATEQDLTMADYVIRRCLGAAARPKPRSRRSDA